ncbi:MAG: hypothetical protein JXM73_03020 [Anaerolineae bacterium]|nr:hypothetical protein [Anaerolineae bacterium]
MKPARFALCLALILAAVAWLLPVRPAHADPAAIRVTPQGSTAWPCGDAWQTACDLQTALAHAAAGDEIWIAAGTYTPTHGADRTASFQLKNGVALYGGFAGVESARDERDWLSHPTILSGDLGVPGDPSDNSYHVLLSGDLDASLALDGLIVRGGNADGASPYDRGGGLYNDHGRLTLVNLIFEGNAAGLGGGLYSGYAERLALTNVHFHANTAGSGGGLFSYSSSPVLVGVSFTANSAADGGGMYNVFSQAVVANVTFDGNTAANWGGGVYNAKCNPALVNVAMTGNQAGSGGALANHWASPRLTNVTLVGNSAGHGGALYNAFYSSPVIRNAILWDNGPDQIDDDPDSSADVAYSDVQGGYGGLAVVDADPQFVAGSLQLRPTSPAVDAGDNDAGLVDGEDLDGDGDLAEPLPFDLAGLPRFADVLSMADTGSGAAPIVDMGAYETHPFYVTLPLVVR